MVEPTMNSRKHYVPLDNRYAERVAVTCRVRYAGEVPTQPHQGEGLTKTYRCPDAMLSATVRSPAAHC